MTRSTGTISGCNITKMALWITPGRLDVNKISVADAANNGVYDRLKILYQYNDHSEPRDLVITVDKDPAAYIKCKGVQKDVFTQGDKRIATNRYGAQFVLSETNDYHTELYQAFADIKCRVQELTGCVASFPARDLDGYTVLYTNLIHSNDGKMFSAAYTANDTLNITECKPCVTRPAFLLSIFKKSSTEIKVRVQVSQMYVHQIYNEFPLANLD